jgi:hypothetical protein
MSGTATSPDAQLHPHQRLRLVHDTDARHAEPGQHEEELALEQTALGSADVLVAGADASSRSRMLGQLRNLLPASTRFLEARETWEMLARASSSRMVVLTDDLGDVSTESLVRMLGRRHPTLPVLAVGNQPRVSAPVDVDVATL